MHSFYFHRLGLMNKASDTPEPTTGGDNPPAPQQAPQNPAGTGVPPPAPTTAKAGIVDRAKVFFAGKEGIATELAGLKTQVETLTAANGDLTQKLATVTAERDELQGQFNQLDAALKQAEGEKTTLQREVTHQLASTGLPEASLPKAAPTALSEKGSIDDQIAAIHKRSEESNDPREKGKLANEAWELELKKAKGETK